MIKTMGKKNNAQFGFRVNHRTADSVFILKTLINKYIHKNKRKLYVCFVDLKKAFDSLWRIGMLYKLAKMGVGKHMFEIIKQQFIHTEASIKYNDKHSRFFPIDRGVKQGDSISPTLFNLFINDIVENFDHKGSTPLRILNSDIGSLLFADDLIILSESKEGLQNSLNNLSNYCEKWQLCLNSKKNKNNDH